MLTEKQLEEAAKIRCRKMGLDPYDMIPHGASPPPGGGPVPAILFHSPRWKLMVEDIRSHIITTESINEAVATVSESS